MIAFQEPFSSTVLSHEGFMIENFFIFGMIIIFTFHFGNHDKIQTVLMIFIVSIWQLTNIFIRFDVVEVLTIVTIGIQILILAITALFLSMLYEVRIKKNDNSC